MLLVAAVVAAVTLLAGAVPPMLYATAGDAVRDAVRRSGADLQVHARMERDDGQAGTRVRAPRLAEDVDDFRNRAADELGPGLRAALHPPVATVTSPTLKITDGSVLRTFQLAYLARDGGPGVTWIAGGPPEPTGSETAEVPYGAPPWPVRVGLSEADAAALRVGPGDGIPLADDQGNVKKVEVSGVFRPQDSADPAWRLVPALLRPVAGADGSGSTRLAGLLSRESLPDARLAFGQDELRRTAHFTPDPSRLTWDSVASVAARVVELKASSGSSGARDGSLRWETRLDGVLRDVRARVSAAFAQAAVLLVAVLAVAVLVLLLAAELLVRRRAPALAAARQRGMSLPVIGGELALESVVVAVLAGAAGLGLAGVVTDGVSWEWVVPVVVAAVAAGPGFGTLAASRATRDRRVPANRSARRWLRHTVRLRRAALEAGVLVAAAGAFAALFQRGIVSVEGASAASASGALVGGDLVLPGSASGALAGGDVVLPASVSGALVGGDLVLPASAPALGALVGALVVVRLLPAATRFVLGRLLRSRRPLAVFGAARAAASVRVLPLAVLMTSLALGSFALTLAATLGQGAAEGPLASGLLRLAWVSAVALSALGLLGLVLGAAAGAPERWQTLSRLRTLGLRPREARWVAAGELLPMAAVPAVAGPLLGVLLARVTSGSLGLGTLVGGGPGVVLPWWWLALVAVTFLAAVAVVVPVESALRRRRRLSEVLRAGE
ncbi:hypothetical protein GCM10009850_030750 [Nonomuraea monospora]|uniref:ABC3 transporter permease C-terminal domain-containing protein n=1 Tax=Nonomuraea monospora TaxID=568818 RepID=A0ABN3CEU7_9ACTN